MEEFKWRSKSRKVACVNLIILTLYMFMSVIIKDTTVDKDSFVTQVFNNKDLEGKDEDVLMLVSLFVFSVIIMLLILGFCAAVKLFRSTELGRDPQEALALAQFWQIVNLIYILLGSLLLFKLSSFLSVLVHLMLVGTFIAFWYIVIRFMNELKEAVNMMKAAAPINVNNGV